MRSIDIGKLVDLWACWTFWQDSHTDTHSCNIDLSVNCPLKRRIKSVKIKVAQLKSKESMLQFDIFYVECVLYTGMPTNTDQSVFIQIGDQTMGIQI